MWDWTFGSIKRHPTKPRSDHGGQFASRINTTGSPNSERMLTDICVGSTNTSRKTLHSSALGRVLLIELVISLEVPVFWALFESVDGIEAQPARFDAAVINKVTPRIRAAFLFSVIGISELLNR